MTDVGSILKSRMCLSQKSHISYVLPLLVLLVRHAMTSCPTSSSLNGCSCNGNSTSLTIFCIQSNLTHIPTDFPSKVIKLYINRNTIAEVPYIPYTRLRILDLQYNQISSITARAFKDLTKLDHLYLSHNNLHSLTMFTFNGLNGLNYLELNDNQINQISPNTFTGVHFRELHVINLAENSLNIADHIFSNFSLGELNLSHNQLNKVPVFGRNFHLQSLHLDSNQITELPEYIFLSVPNLTMLSIKDNGVSFISPNALTGLLLLNELQLDHNNISHIYAGTFKDTLLLHNLHLAWNNLQTLDEDVDGDNALARLTLHDNPWTCNCSLRWMTSSELVRNSNPHTNFTCVAPNSLSGIPVLQLHSGAFGCKGYSYKGGSIRIGLAIGLIVVLLSGIGFIAYLYKRRKRRRHLYSRHIPDSSIYKNVTEPDESAPGGFFDDDGKTTFLYRDSGEMLNYAT